MGAGTYMLCASLSVLVWSILTVAVCKLLADAGRITVEELNILVSGLGVVLGMVFYSLSARRLKDLNMSPWLVKLLAFPLLALILMPYLCLVSGPQLENKYGPAPRSSGFGKVLAAVVALFLAINVSFGTMGVYYRSKHALTIGRPQ